LKTLLVSVFLFVLLTPVIFINTRAQVRAAASTTLNFQAALLTSSGAPVPDGDYHIEFKLYTAATGGSDIWTETRSTGNLVEVKDGHFSVYLGSVNPLPAADWNEEHWVTMNVGGSGGSPAWDGEMLNSSSERMKLTAVPYAFQAGGLATTNGANRATLDFTTPTNNRTITLPDASGTVCLEGSSTCNFIQIAPLSMQTVNNANTAIQINQQGSGDLLQLQSGGVDQATIAANGNTYFAGALDIDGGSLNIGSASVLGAMVFNDGSANTLTLQPGSMATDLVLTLPTADGNIGDCLKTDGAGTLSFGACGGGAAVTKVKTTNETENNVTNPTATLQPDDELFLAIGANETWTVRFIVQANANTAPDIKFSVTAPAGATCTVGVADHEAGASISNLGCGVSSGLIAGTSANEVYEVVATVTNGGTAGNVTLNWAQNTGSALNTVVLAGSSLHATSTTSTGSAIIQDGNTFGAPITIGSNDSNDLNFETNATTRMTIDATGNITAVGDVAVQGNFTMGNASTDRVTINGQILGSTPLTFQGASDDGFSTNFTFAEPTANNTITFPDATGTVCLTTSGCAVSGGTAGGDLSGSYPNPTVARINGATLGTTTASTGNILVADGSLWSSVAMSGDASINSSGAITINNDAVALGTDTTGNYIATIASGNGIGVTGSGSENAGASLDLAALTADWNQTGAFDLQLNNSASELKILESAGGTFFGILDSGDLTADRTITIPDASGEICLNTGNCTAAGTAGGDLSGTYPNATVARINGVTLGSTTASAGRILVGDGSQWVSVAMSSDATLASSGALTIGADAVALATDTTGDYIATIANGSGISVSGSGGENAAATIALGAMTTDWNQSGAFDINLSNAGSELRIMESVGATFYGIFDAGDLSADRTLTIPNESGTICVQNSVDCGFTMFDEATAQTDGGTNTSIFINKTGATGNILNLQDNGVDAFTVANNGALDINTASTTAFQVSNGATTNLTVDTSTGGVYIGSTTTDATQVLFQVDSFSTFADTATCATTTNQGAMYYNTNTNSMRGCINGTWEDMMSTQGLGLLMFGVVPDSSNAGTPGDIGGITGNANSPCMVTWTSASTVTVNPCIAYSGGRKVIVASTVISVAAMANNNYANICLTGANSQPALGTANATETSAATPTFSTNNPILCLATVRTTPAGTLANIWDTRTFTTTRKIFATINSVNTNGFIVIGSTSNLTVTTNTLSNGPIRGVVVASTRTASNSTVNAILAVAGHQYVKITAGATANVNGVIQTNNVAGYARTNTTFTTSYSSAGVLQKTVSTTCNAVTNCQYSGLVELEISR
jgi:hypothetical protein